MSTKQKRIAFSKFWSQISKKCRFKGCVFPEKANCSKKLIKAHSIQKAKILNCIAENGMVISADVRTLFYTNQFNEVGVNSASTFFGFCSNHDISIFSEIENNDYNASNEHNFLHGYRACALEYVKKRESLCRLMGLIKNFRNTRYMASLSPALLGTKQAVIDLKTIIDIFSNELIKSRQSRKFSKIETNTFELSFESLIAVNSVLTIKYDFQGNLINDLNDFSTTPAPIFLSVFPQTGKTFILFSWLARNSEIYQGIISKLNSFSDSELELYFSKLIIEHCENLFMSPIKYKRISKETRSKIVSKFIESINNPPNPGYLTQETSINLFRLMKK